MDEVNFYKKLDELIKENITNESDRAKAAKQISNVLHDNSLNDIVLEYFDDADIENEMEARNLDDACYNEGYDNGYDDGCNAIDHKMHDEINDLNDIIESKSRIFSDMTPDEMYQHMCNFLDIASFYDFNMFTEKFKELRNYINESSYIKEFQRKGFAC